MSTHADHPREWTPASIRELASGFQPSRVLLTAIELRVFSVDGGRRPHVGRRRLAARERPAGDRPAAERAVRDRAALEAARPIPEHLGQRALPRREQPGVRRRAGPYGRPVAHVERAHRHGAPGDAGPSARTNDRGDSWVKPFIAAMHYRARQQAPWWPGSSAWMASGACSMSAEVPVPSPWPSRSTSRDSRPSSSTCPPWCPSRSGRSPRPASADRVTVQVGDYLEDPLPGGFDLVFLSAVVHSNGLTENAALRPVVRGGAQPGRPRRDHRLGDGRRPGRPRRRARSSPSTCSSAPNAVTRSPSRRSGAG